jgi:hypothetical protein
VADGLKFFIAVCAYALLGRLALDVAALFLPKRTAAIVVAFPWLLGFIWLSGAVLLGPRGGNALLRWWIGIYGGMAIAIGPFAFVPHPVILIVGAGLGFAFLTWVVHGKAEWL